MKWIRRPHPLEPLIDFAVALLVGGAAGYAAWRGALAAWLVGAAVLAGVVIAAGILRWAGAERPGSFDFAPEAIAAPVEATPAEDELMLEDALGTLHADSRVVRLFAPETMALPGELAERIDDWIEGARNRTGGRVAVAIGGGGHGPTSGPASAALHAALADIKRSLG